jgi:hypothetical protein
VVVKKNLIMVQKEWSGEVVVHAAECRPTVRKVAIPVCTKKIREKRDREVKKAWKGSNAWADVAMMGNMQHKNGMKSGGKELPLE